MQITFAIQRDIDGQKYEPDQTADIPDAIAKQLLADGYARRAAADASAPSVTPPDGGDALDLGGSTVEEPAHSPTPDSPYTGETGQE